ncbi:MAG: hypothetical protein H6611_09810 [Ignavibacteriales bacterium]|nr:hypothetical protein [Ignavibacteriales bacterium]
MKKFLLSIVGILFLIFIFLFWGGNYFTTYSINSKIENLRDSIDFSQKELFTYSQLSDKPKLLQKYFSKVVNDNSYVPNFISLNQSGEFKTDVNSEWLPIKASEYFTIKKPNFLWQSEIKNSKFFWVKAIDSYLNGTGNMLIKINSSITIADSWGIELDKSGLFRYLSESVFFPTSLLPSENLEWNILDSNIAEIKYKDGDNSVVAKFYFSEDSTISKIETRDKYRAMNSDYKESLYTIYFYNYKYFNNSFFVPSYFEVEWDLGDSKFKYGKFKIENITYE